MIRYTLEGTARSYKDVPKGAQITEVNGRDVHDVCLGCGKPILVGHEYHAWEDGITRMKCGGPEEDGD